MNSVKFKDTWFTILGDGIYYDDNILRLEVLADGQTVETMKGLLNPVPELLEIYDENHDVKTGEFKGYTVISSLMEKYDRRISQNAKADTIIIELKCPELANKLDAVEAQSFYTAMVTDTLLEE